MFFEGNYFLRNGDMKERLSLHIDKFMYHRVYCVYKTLYKQINLSKYEYMLR